MNLGQRRRPREADDAPADAVAVAAVDRVGVEPLPRVEAEQAKKVEVDLGVGLLEGRRSVVRVNAARIVRLELLQHGVLLARIE